MAKSVLWVTQLFLCLSEVWQERPMRGGGGGWRLRPALTTDSQLPDRMSEIYLDRARCTQQSDRETKQYNWEQSRSRPTQQVLNWMCSQGEIGYHLISFSRRGSQSTLTCFVNNTYDSLSSSLSISPNRWVFKICIITNENTHGDNVKLLTIKDISLILNTKLNLPFWNPILHFKEKNVPTVDEVQLRLIFVILRPRRTDDHLPALKFSTRATPWDWAGGSSVISISIFSI